MGRAVFTRCQKKPVIIYQLGKGIRCTYSPALSLGDATILCYAASAYGFLLNQVDYRNKSISWADFATLIRQHYAETPRTAAVLSVVERAHEYAGEGDRVEAVFEEQQVSITRGRRRARRRGKLTTKN